MPDKLTDSEIVKAWEICGKSTNGCSHSKYTCEDCYLNGQPMCSSVLLQDTIDYFNRLQADNEKLLDTRWSTNQVEKLQNTTRIEAYKECIEKVKALFPSDNEPYQYWEIHEGADNLLKELVGEDNG